MESFAKLTNMDGNYYYYVSPAYIKLIHILVVIKENGVTALMDEFKKSLEKLERDHNLLQLINAI